MSAPMYGPYMEATLSPGGSGCWLAQAHHHQLLTLLAKVAVFMQQHWRH